jgi:hypothetical protein
MINGAAGVEARSQRIHSIFSAWNQAGILHTVRMTKTRKCIVLLALAGINGSLLAQDIIFTNRMATFTNLEGRVYTSVTLTKADLDGLIWHDDKGSAGRVCYTNLNPALLEQLGIPLDRVHLAKIRAERKAAYDSQYRAAQRSPLPPNTNQMLAGERLRGLVEF